MKTTEKLPKNNESKYKIMLINLLIHDRMTSDSDLRKQIIHLTYHGMQGYKEMEISDLEQLVEDAYSFNSDDCYICQICQDDVIERDFREHSVMHNSHAENMPYKVLSGVFDTANSIKAMVLNHIKTNVVPDYVSKLEK